MKIKGGKWKLWSADSLAYLLIIIFIGLFIFLSIGRHNDLRSFQNDLGAYSQTIWNTLHGHFFESSGSMLGLTLKPDGTSQENYNFLAGHFSPILLIFVPLYFIWSDPKLLLIVQAIAVGLGALPIYWLAKEKIKVKWAGLAFLISFLSYPIIHNALLYDFHEVTCAIPIVTFALWFWHKNRMGWMLFFLALLMLIQEHTSLIVLMFGILLMVKNKKWKLGLGISLVAIAYFLLVMLVLIPAFSSTGESALIKSETLNIVTTGRYSWLGSNIGEIVGKIFTDPIYVLKNMFTFRQVDFLVTLLIPLFGLPLFSSLFILTLPILALYFLSFWWLTYSVYFYHSSILAGILYFAAIYSFARLFREIKWQKIYLALIVISSLAISYVYTVTPFSKNYTWQEYIPSEHAKLLKEVKALIPADASLSVQHNLGPHFTTRRQLFHFPVMIKKSDYVVVDVYNPYAVNPKSFFKFGNVKEVEYEVWRDSIWELIHNTEFGVIYGNDGWLVFQRGASRALNEKAEQDFQAALERLVPTLSGEEFK